MTTSKSKTTAAPKKTTPANKKPGAKAAPAIEGASPYQPAYERCKAHIAAVDESKLVAVNIDIPSVLYSQASLLASHLDAHMDEIADQLPRVDRKKLAMLRDARDAVMHLHVVLSRTTVSPAQIAAMTAEAIERRRKLVVAFEALAAYGLLDGGKLADLRAAGKAPNVAVGLMGICSALVGSWDAIAAHTPVTREEMAEANALSVAIVAANADRTLDPTELAAVTKERERAFTFFLDLYTGARTVLRYLRAPFGDEDEVAPSLYAGQGGGRTVTKEPEPTPAEPAPAPVVTTPPAEAFPFPKVPVGHPGGNPFAT